MRVYLACMCVGVCGGVVYCTVLYSKSVYRKRVYIHYSLSCTVHTYRGKERQSTLLRAERKLPTVQLGARKCTHRVHSHVHTALTAVLVLYLHRLGSMIWSGLGCLLYSSIL